MVEWKLRSSSGKHEGRLWASLRSLERPKDFKDMETAHLSGDRYIFFQRHGHLLRDHRESFKDELGALRRQSLALQGIFTSLLLMPIIPQMH